MLPSNKNYDLDQVPAKFHFFLLNSPFHLDVRLNAEEKIYHYFCYITTVVAPFYSDGKE